MPLTTKSNKSTISAGTERHGSLYSKAVGQCQSAILPESLPLPTESLPPLESLPPELDN
ncbi:hypothetical protein NK638_05270 [Psychrobacter sp. A3]|uniref:hypothetical protein n=1 Tax=Psychrobacter sp. A3 TaxID=2992754 RepID=UPI00237B2B0C|nr:hypothetical protein [Psychrobacter sp. A3]MDE0490948.1 hypothetical protein [Psychrobacter sp. A3]